MFGGRLTKEAIKLFEEFKKARRENTPEFERFLKAIEEIIRIDERRNILRELQDNELGELVKKNKK